MNKKTIAFLVALSAALGTFVAKYEGCQPTDSTQEDAGVAGSAGGTAGAAGSDEDGGV